MTRIGHVVAGFLSMVCVLFAGVVLADGRSLMITKAGYLPDGSGLGAWKDSRGNGWTDEAHFVGGQNCSDHEERGNGVKAFTMISLAVSSVAVLVSLFGAGSEGGMLGKVSGGVNVFMFIAFLLAMCLGWSLFDETFDCGAVELRLKDRYELNYGLFFLLAGVVLSCINCVVLCVTGSMKDLATEAEAEANFDASHEPVGDVVEDKGV
eukprot:TRINITY_DN458_c0_g8_i1.p1 TRINITY_DN458_c0_g8~~TRINITY_DN458_c0_g8_i1.p1  ORF type:complete len:217 (+),score=57.77 TRINITY_DN458_c0_g8_i1:28-651(+)